MWFYVFIGGGLGSLSRYYTSRWLNNPEWYLPYGTLMSNLLASLLLGGLVQYSLNQGLSTNRQLLLMTGFCGGFSTFSTFSYELYDLLMHKQLSVAFTYLIGSILLGLVFVYFGMIIARLAL